MKICLPERSLCISGVLEYSGELDYDLMYTPTYTAQIPVQNIHN